MKDGETHSLILSQMDIDMGTDSSMSQWTSNMHEEQRRKNKWTLKACNQDQDRDEDENENEDVSEDVNKRIRRELRWKSK